MIAIGIIFLILYAFFMMCLIGSLAGIQKVMQAMINRQDEIIRMMKNK